MKTTFIKDIKPGQSVNDIFVIRDLQMLYKKNGDPYLSFTLLDKTGEIKAVAWDRVGDFNDLLTGVTYIKINGRVSEYMGALQFTTNCAPGIQLVSSEDADAKDFLPVVDRDIDEMFNELIMHAYGVGGNLKDLLVNFLSDDAFTASFKSAPGGKRMHHAYIGGLLEHTLTMTGMGFAVLHYVDGLDKDLLITGIILHDIGKIHEYTYETPPIDVSDAGRLIGHIGIGLQMLDQKLKELSDFPENLATQLRHMIVSHHGKREWGSPEPPKTLEAIVLHNLDMLDAQVAAVKSFMDKHPEPGWTGYHKILGRHFYNPKKENYE